jgi:branched-chain amino acid transport system substrate-binding protein
MHQFKKLCAVAIALVAVASACSSQAGTTQTGTGGAPAGSTPSGEPIVIGMVMSTSGPAATLGEFQARGVELAVESINSKGGVNGRPLKLIKKDDQSNPERAVAETRTLIGEKVHAIVGSGTAGTCYAMEPVIKEAKMPTYCLSGAPAPPNNTTMFFGLPPLEAFAAAQFPWMKSKNYDGLAVLHSTDATGKLISEQLPKLADKASIKVTGIEQFDLTAQDVSAQLTKLRGTNPKVLYIGNTGGGPTATVLRGLRDIGWDIPVVLTWSNATDAFLKTVAPVAAKETYIGGTQLYVASSLPDSAANKAAYMDYIKLYGSKYSDKPDMYSASGFDAVGMLAKSIAATNGQGEAVRDYMLNGLGTYAGVTGSIKFSKDDLRGVSPDSVILMKVTAQGYERVAA